MLHSADPTGLEFDPMEGHGNRHRWTRRTRRVSLMGCRPYRWTEAKRADVEKAVHESRTRAEAAEKLGTTKNGLDAAAKVYGFSLGEMLGASLRVAPAPVPEPAPAPVDWTGARPPVSTGAGLERRLVIADTHFPFASLLALRGLLALARATQPRVVLHLGDIFNMGAVSRHPRPFGGRENHRGAMAQGLSFLDALSRAAPGARHVLLLGNHDDWAAEYEDEHPEFGGMFSAEAMGLERLGWEIVPRSRQPLVLGPVAYEHGTGGGLHFAQRYALHAAPRVNVRHYRVGHHHRCSRFHAKNGAECVSVPWLGDSRASAFDYAPDKGDWEIGALVDDVMGERVTTTPVRIENGASLFGGRMVAA